MIYTKGYVFIKHSVKDLTDVYELGVTNEKIKDKDYEIIYEISYENGPYVIEVLKDKFKSYKIPFYPDENYYDINVVDRFEDAIRNTNINYCYKWRNW